MVDKLLKKIEVLEEQAGLLDPTDTDALYKLLVTAYFHAKDVIVALQEVAPEPVKVINTDEIERLQFELQRATAKVVVEVTARELLQKQINDIKGIITPV